MRFYQCFNLIYKEFIKFLFQSSSMTNKNKSPPVKTLKKIACAIIIQAIFREKISHFYMREIFLSKIQKIKLKNKYKPQHHEHLHAHTPYFSTLKNIRLSFFPARPRKENPQLSPRCMHERVFPSHGIYERPKTTKSKI